MGNTNWLERSIISLLPLSKSKVFSEAIKEWVYNDNFFDAEAANEECKLCGHPEIRYQFEIINELNKNTLLIGSECIKKFEIKVLDEDGSILNRKDAGKKVDGHRSTLIKVARRKRVIKKLVELSGKDSAFNISDFIDYYQEREGFTPLQMNLLIWRFKNYKISFNPIDFNLRIQRKREKEQLLDMPQWKVNKIYPVMTKAQIKWYEDNKDDPI